MLTAFSTDLFSRQANCRKSSRGQVMFFRWFSTRHSNNFMTADVIVTDLSLFGSNIAGFLGTVMMVDCLKQDRSSQSSRCLWKICVKTGATWSAQTFRQEGGRNVLIF